MTLLSIHTQPHRTKVTLLSRGQRSHRVCLCESGGDGVCAQHISQDKSFSA